MWYAERFPWHAAFTAVPIYFYLFDQCLYNVKNVSIHIPDFVETI